MSKDKKTTGRRWLLWLPLFVCGTLLFVTNVFQSQYIGLPSRIYIQGNTLDDRSLKGFLIKTPGCRIPFMDPFDPTVRKFIHKEDRPICNKGIPALVDSNLTSIFLVNSSLDKYTDKDISAVKCCYQPFYRVEPTGNEDDNITTFDKNCTPFNGSADISDEFIKVVCDVNNTNIYTDLFSFVPVKMKKPTFIKGKDLNVLVIGLDGTSRVNFHRQMPQTVKYLKSIGAVELLGYNKIADNTFLNVITVLSGHNEDELIDLCWKHQYDRFDDCPFIWNDYKAKGYVTSFGEDASWMGIFNYKKKGFKTQPTDYMWTVFDRLAESLIGNSHNNLNVMECMGAREVYKLFVNHMRNFITRMDMEQLPYFAFYWGASLTHDVLNKPNSGDEDYYKFFKHLKENNHLNNTVMVVMSDHGIRWGGIRYTYQGRMEERLPLVFIVLPKWYKTQYKLAYRNLVKNTRRLTTPYDMHETLKDLVNPYILTDLFLRERNRENKVGSYSLFNEISPKRTCEDAGISSHWCTCQQSIRIDKNDTVVKEGANFAVNYINHQLKGYAQCSNLSLDYISDASVMTHGEHILNGTKTRDYMIVFQTFPGYGIFEVTLRNTFGHNETHHFEVTGTISRLNLYRTQSACITDFHLKLYCYCKH